MTRKLMLLISTLVLAFSLPVGSAFAVTSPNVDSPNVNSPNVDSPNVDSPNVDSPNVDSPNVDAPGVLFSDTGSSEAAMTNVVANTLDRSAASGVASQESLLSPHSGAMNFGIIAVGTALLFAVAGLAAWALRRELK